MAKGKSMREKGKLQLNKYFQDLKVGDRVAVVIEGSTPFSFPERMQGRTGKVEAKRGRAYVVKIKDQQQEKRFIIAPIHLKKMTK